MNKLFPQYPNGSRLTILDTIYHRPPKLENGKYGADAITLIAKDLDSMETVHYTIEDPDFEFYTVKSKYIPMIGNYYHTTYPEKWLDLRVCKYSNNTKTIAKLLGRYQEYKDLLFSSGTGRKKINRIHADNRVCRSTMHISDFYRYKFSVTYTNEPFQLHKGYFDIEADAEKAIGEFPEMGECPVNSVSFIDSYNKRCYIFVLEDKTNPQYYEFKKDVSENVDDIVSDIWHNIELAMGGDISKIEKYHIDGMKFTFLFYEEDKEIEMIRDLFKIMRLSKVDFVLAWNMKFDIPYLIERCKKLGYDPADIMCDPSFPRPICEYVEDTFNRDNYHLRGDRADFSVPFVLNDQLLTFTGRRKANITSFPNFKLDTIANLTAGIHKLDYSEWTNNVKYLPKINYRIFVIYNIIDTVNQMCIEESEKDIDYLFALALESNTRYSKFNKPSVVLYNEAHKLYKELLGLIVGNNVNTIFGTPKEPYEGAYVSEPRLLDDYSKMDINGLKIPVCNNVADEDFSSMYPSEARNFNMSNETQIGKIIIPKKIRDNEAYLHEKSVAITNMGKIKGKDYTPPKFNRSGAYIEDLSTGNWLIFGHRWFNLLNYKELLEYIAKYYSEYRQTDALLRDFKGGIISKSGMYSRVPWCIHPQMLYNNLYNDHDASWSVRIPVSKEMEEKVNDVFNSKRMF